VTVAATPHCWLTVMAVGGAKLGVKVTVMAGGVEFAAPQAAKSARATAAINAGSWRRRLIFELGIR